MQSGFFPLLYVQHFNDELACLFLPGAPRHPQTGVCPVKPTHLFRIIRFRPNPTFYFRIARLRFSFDFVFPVAPTE